MFVVDNKMMRCDAELGAVVIITAMACYGCDKLYFVSSLWRSKSKGSVLGVVVLIKCSSPEEWYNLYWNKSLLPRAKCLILV